MKTTGDRGAAPGAPLGPALAAPATEPRADECVPVEGGRASVEGGTRLAVARLLLEQGPITAVDVAAELELSPAAVRRHLDALLADGEATTRNAPRRGQRGRGRPARLYLLTEAGRVRFGHGYDDLAVAALRFLAETGGPHAVRDFADRRATQLVARYRDGTEPPADAVDRAGVAERVAALASVLSAQGYAAAARRAANGAQLCQHHCPVAHVATEFPELCEAETHAFAELLGTHVQRLATIARGDAACTTHIPTPTSPNTTSALNRTSAPTTTTTNIPKGRQRV